MSIVDLFQDIWQATKRKPSRTILTGVGVAWGIFILILLVGVGEGFRGGVMSLFSGFSQKTTYVYAGWTTKAYAGTQENTGLYFTIDDVEMLKSNISDITYISPEVASSMSITNLDVLGRNSVYGIYPEYFKMQIPNLDNGRLINQNDFSQKRKVVVIGAEVARYFFDKQNPIGRDLSLNGNVFKVVGVVSNSLLNNNIDRALYIPYSSFALMMSNDMHFSTLSYSIKDKAETKEVTKLVRSHLSRFHAVAPDDDSAFYFGSMEQIVEAFDTLFDGLNKFLWFLGLATLFSGVIGVANMMYTSAKERTREIGIRKAIGAKPSSIKNMFICESIVLTTIAGYVGVFLGWLVLLVIGVLMPEDSEILQKPAIDLPIALAATLVLVVSGTLSGLRPAIYASQLNPIEALKEEN